MAYYATVGCVGNPDDDSLYESFKMDDMTIHVEKTLLKEIPESGGSLKISFGDYGFFEIVFRK